MRTIQTKIYQFKELSEEAKQKSIENLSYINVDFEWWNYTYYDAKRIGLIINEFDLNRNKHCKGEFDISASECAKKIIGNHGEKTDTYLCASNFLEEWEPLFQRSLNDDLDADNAYSIDILIGELDENFLNDLLECYASILQYESEYLQSEEAIIATIILNEYEFTENGKLF